MSWIRAAAHLEVRALRAVNGAACRPALRRAFGTVSRLGDGAAWYGLVAAIAVLGGARGRRVALAMIVTGLLALLVYRGLKHLIARPRPCERFEDLHLTVPPLDRWSFPSGHTMHATSFTLVAVSAYPALGWILVPFTAMVMASRVVLGLHYPSDVLAGAASGWVVVRTLAALGVLAA